MAGRSLRLIFFGTPAFAVPTLDALVRSRHTVLAAVMQPDRPQGRGHQVHEGEVKRFAREHDLLTLQPERIRTPELLDAIRALGADLGIVAAYGKILPEGLLQLPPLGMVNVHASLLPRYRGAAPVHRAVIAGETETGVTIMRVVPALDAGPMLANASRPIGPDDTSDVVERDLAEIGARLLVDTVDRLADGPIEEIEQDDGAATYAARLTRHDSPLDWTHTARTLHNQVRGLHPWPLASTSLHGRRFIIRRTAVEESASRSAPGTIVEAAGERLCVATGDGMLRVLELQPEGKRAMATRDFLAGHGVAPGAQFDAPAPRP
ncbi:MAG TPA: methionyl-tRNA formyltransferase [Vicinamibacterales bacterium]